MAEQIYKLRSPFVFEETTYTELRLDFEKLTGEDLIAAERAFNRDNGSVGQGTMIKEFNKSYLAHVSALAASVPVELIKKLSAKDFSAVTLEAQNFLLM